jgi:hypothetical protein
MPFIDIFLRQVLSMEETMPWLNLLFKDSTGVALADKAFKLVVESRDPVVGTTDKNGRLRCEVAAGTRRATLFFRYRRFELELDALPEVAEVAGVQERLNLLNYFTGRVDGDLGPRTRNALKSFQREHALDETGECDEATLRSLKEAFGA